MDLLEAIRKRKTTNSPFRPERIRDEHKRLLIEAASRAPSHFNSQPWRFIVIEDRERIAQIADIAGDSMKRLMDEGAFVARYRRYFRFDAKESMATGSGIYIDNMPAVLRPMVRLVFSEQVGSLLNKLGASAILGNDQRKIVRSAPMLLAITLDKQEYRPGELSGLYASITLGAVIQTLWLVTTALDIGMQFISTPLEVAENKARLVALLKIPEAHELVAIFRMGYKDPHMPRNTIDWTSNQRKPFTELTRYNDWDTPVPESLAKARSLLWGDSEQPSEP
ncbi:MAG: nitroreductase family protein [Thermoflexales bacterium]|nr:nitroreductase family protein [Thermoflexales bacterium]MDW8351416.1 nitroreductase family protein [Anaerolineae bacterium]